MQTLRVNEALYLPNVHWTLGWFHPGHHWHQYEGTIYALFMGLLGSVHTNKCQKRMQNFCPVVTGYGRRCVYILIRWTLLGSYVCFTTTSLDTADTHYVQLVSTRLLLLLVSVSSNYCCTGSTRTKTTTCTVPQTIYHLWLYCTRP